MSFRTKLRSKYITIFVSEKVYKIYFIFNTMTIEHGINTSDDISFNYIYQGVAEQILIDKKHILIFVYAGELFLWDGQQQTVIRVGECVFIKSNTNLVITKKPFQDNDFRGIVWGLGYDFLGSFYQKMKYHTKPSLCTCLNENIVKLSSNVYIESFYVSLKPYLCYNTKPDLHILELKSQEVVHCILSTDVRLYCSLFDTMCWGKYDEGYYLN